MRSKISFLSFFAISALFMASCSQGGQFISDGSYLKQVQSDFQSKIDLVGSSFYAPEEGISEAESEALQFLYAYMPVADVTDYSTAYHLENVRQSFKAREEMPWGKVVPELYFRHFVLPVRVNNENLDDFRKVYYDELKNRVKGMSMEDAILEINHWCHEHVAYQPSDGRTSSPMASMKSAYGRCGEESTYTVAALRTIGIPARQVYTPRWAHTDNNHAWVEAWADGKWHFLGACEPEPVLDLGWFNSAASRAMLMHTRVFGRYDGPEEKMLETNTFTEINLIDNYASTGRIDFAIVDASSSPVDNARVDFMIYNYGQFCPVVTKYAGSDGRVFLTAGLGDMMVWASKDGKYGYAKASFGKDKEITINISHDSVSDKQQDVYPVEMLDIVPPAESYTLPDVTDEQRQLNDSRKIYEDSIRTAYMATFMNNETAAAYAKDHGLGEEVIPFIARSSGNSKVISEFALKEGAADLLKTLSLKDLKDVSMEVLMDNYLDSEGTILNPRVESEMLVPYKHFFKENIAKEDAVRFVANPAELVKWCKDSLTLIEGPSADRIAMSSVGVWRSRVADARSRNIFFVNVARSLGIESRLERMTGKLQYMKDGQWMDVDFEAAKEVVSPKGTLVLNYTPTADLENPEYFSHFTITKIENGLTNTLSFSNGQVDMGEGGSWAKTFGKGVTLDEGTYMLVTGRRLANGSVMAASQIFNVSEGKTTTLDLPMREVSEEVAVIGSINSESKYISLPDNVEQSVLSQTGRGYFIIGVLGVGQEPTNHTLNDIAQKKDQIEAWGRKIILLFPDEEHRKMFRVSDYGELPANVVYGIDKDNAIQKQIAANMHLKNVNQLPMFIIGDTFDRVVFLSQGYTIGLGEQLVQTIKKL